MAQSLCVSHFGKHYMNGLVLLGGFFCIIFYCFIELYIFPCSPLHNFETQCEDGHCKTSDVSNRAACMITEALVWVFLKHECELERNSLLHAPSPASLS